MKITRSLKKNNSNEIKRYYDIAKTKLFPIMRSLTGEGVRTTLKIIQKEFYQLKIKKFKSGTNVFDWIIPEEWNVSEAYVMDKYKNKIIDFKINNLHLLGYSIPVKKKISGINIIIEVKYVYVIWVVSLIEFWISLDELLFKKKTYFWFK